MNRQAIIGIIPARMASTRFPGKPMAKICGMPMIGHVYFRSKMCSLLDEVYVATCDKEIEDYVHSIHGEVVMTKPTHERASDRCAEALEKIEVAQGAKVQIVVMIQGDEPLLHPQMIEDSIRPILDDDSALVVNLMAKMDTRSEHEDPNEVKVVTDLNGFALYFSREPIPSRKKGAKNILMLKQVCIIPFRRDFLETYGKLPPTPLEIAESVDMMRVLEHGYKVKMVLSKFATYSVDTPEQLARVEEMIKRDALFQEYKGMTVWSAGSLPCR